MTRLALLAVTLPLVVGDCALEHAVVTAIPPDAVHVVQVMTCGGVRCWEAWVDAGGRRIRASRACATEAAAGTPDAITVAPPSGP